MSETRARPPEIPADATWLEDVEKWEVVGRDAAGAKDGECHLYRGDGTLYQRSRYHAGQPEGGFVVYHPDGQVAREGHYENGQLAGAVTAYAPADDRGEPLRPCCVPGNAWQMRSHYEGGELLFQRFFDREGRRLLSDGSLCPAPPPDLPERAHFDETERRWVVAPATGQNEEPLWRYYREDGFLEEESRWEDGHRVLYRLHARDGGLRQETAFGRGGRRQGPHRRRFVEGDESPYLDARIHEERGAFEDDEPVGSWTFLDRDGAVVRTALRGRPLPEDGFAHPVFADEPRSPAAWNEMAVALLAEGQTGPALCAAARAAAGGGDLDELVSSIARHTVALQPAPAAALAERAAAAEADPVRALVSALAGGGDPAMLLRSLASAQRDAPRAGCDFVEAALRLAPDRPMTYLTRALLRLELGDDRGARADAARLQPASEESAHFVREYARVLLPRWGFPPAENDLTAGEPAPDPAALEGFPAAPEQPLPAIRRAVQVYATRLTQLRTAVLARRPAGRSPPPWAPPEMGALLPEGPIELRRYSAEIVDETEEGSETITVDIDETLDLDRAGLPALMRVARSQWAALGWLCWSCGLARIAPPERLLAPAGFARAAGTAIARFFRAQDAQATGGLRSRTAGIPGFSWEGLDIDEMPRPFLQLALEEYFEMRALFLWLLSPENLSPFQSDLREGV